MQPWLQPMQRVTGSPARARRARLGSAIWARVIPTASQTPSAIRRSASLGSSTRPVAITGTGVRAVTARANSSIAFRAVGAGGTIQVEPRYVGDEPRVTET